jgi:hypothetical protein
LIEQDSDGRSPETRAGIRQQGYNPEMARTSSKTGKWLATIIVLGGIVLALFALKYRVYTPRQVTPAADPIDNPTTRE